MKNIKFTECLLAWSHSVMCYGTAVSLFLIFVFSLIGTIDSGFLLFWDIVFKQDTSNGFSIPVANIPSAHFRVKKCKYTVIGSIFWHSKSLA